MTFMEIALVVMPLIVAVLTARYFWTRARVLSVFVLVWYLAALCLNAVAIFPEVGVWSPGDRWRGLILQAAMGTPLGVYVWLRLKRDDVRSAVDTVPLSYMAATQAYRVGGFSFLLGYLAGVFPAALALPAAAFDVFIGLTALPLAVLLARDVQPGLARAWNLIGLFDFALAISVTSLSLYGLLALAPAPSAIGQFPGIMITGFAVPFGIIVHVEMLRRLRQAEARPSLEA